MDAHPLGGGELDFDAVVVQHDLVIAGRRFLGRVAEARTVALVGMIGTAGVEFQRPGGRHQQDVTQVRMPCSAEVRVAEAYDG